ncbi:MAG: hypothetical protein JXK07_03075 [Spirochaetes bacterium]|nr:hypothetical protein [Spirochaetota bacterium]MBN2771069.1 hypothetical protein [Spirochaetota bacterium]
MSDNKKSKTDEKLKERIADLSQNLETDELQSIVRQIEILIHNREVVREFQERKAARKLARDNSTEEENLDVKIIESEDGKSFRLFVGNFPKMFMLDEMRRMVKLCHSSKTPEEGAKKLFVWINNNRKDFFMDIQTNNKEQVFLNIRNCLVERYTVK